MSDVTISYKGSPIATMDASGTKTLQTQGKYCEDNITVQYAGGGGSSITVEPLTVTQNGTTTAPSGKAYSPVTVNVPQPSGTKSITISRNGTTAEAVTNYENASITVNVKPNIVYNNGDNTMLSNPFSELDFDKLYANIDNRKVFGFLWFEFNSMTIQVELYARNNIIGGMAFMSQPSPIGVLCEWNASGVVTLDALMNGQVQDMRAYAPRLTAHLYLFGTDAPTPAT
jgi:hypothetical protein